MSDMELARAVIGHEIAAYEEKSEFWKSHHDLAMRCFDFCDLLSAGIKHYQDVCRLDEEWRQVVLRKPELYEAGFDQGISGLFSALASVMFRVESSDAMKFFEAQFGVGEAEGYRKCCRELRDMLTSDEEFFDSPKLEQLRDEAIEANREGRCEPWTA